MAFKPLLATVALAAATVFTAIPAMAQRVDFRGFGYLYDFSDSCLEYDWSGIRPVTVRYRPAGVGDNGGATQLAFFDEFFALGYRQPTGVLDRRWRPVDSGAVFASAYTYVNNVRIRVTTHTPAANRITATTPQVRLVGQVRGFDSLDDCYARFEATVIQRM